MNVKAKLVETATTVKNKTTAFWQNNKDDIIRIVAPAVCATTTMALGYKLGKIKEYDELQIKSINHELEQEITKKTIYFNNKNSWDTIDNAIDSIANDLAETDAVKELAQTAGVDYISVRIGQVVDEEPYYCEYTKVI